MNTFQEKFLIKRFGNIPKDWKIITLGELFKERKELNNDLSAYPLYSFTIEDGVTEKTERYNREHLLKDKGENEYKLVHPKDLVFNPMNLRFGAIAYSRVSVVVSISFYYEILKLIDSDCDITFIESWLRSPALLDLYDRIAIGSLLEKRRIYLSEFKKLRIYLPPKREQQKIAEIFKKWEDCIEITTKLIKAKTLFKIELMQQLLSGKKRFKEFVKSDKKTKTHYSSIPSDWQYPKVKEIAEEVTDRNVAGRNIPVLSCTKYDGLVDSLNYFGRRIFSEDTSVYRIVRRGQFAYATNHIEEGSIGLLDSLSEGLVSPMYTVFKTKEKIYAPFLYKVFKTELYRHTFEINTSASVDRRGSLRWKQFKQIHVPLPTIEEQKKISDCIDACDKEIKLLNQLAETLKIQKKGLMQKLLTGQIRVKV